MASMSTGSGAKDNDEDDNDLEETKKEETEKENGDEDDDKEENEESASSEVDYERGKKAAVKKRGRPATKKTQEPDSDGQESVSTASNKNKSEYFGFAEVNCESQESKIVVI